jgi:hypothetical protein
MDFRRKALAAALLLAQVATTSTALAQQTTPPRRPSGPAAGPVIKLPRGDNASLEQTQSNPSAKEQPTSAASEPKRWEYCAIMGVAWRQKGFSSSTRTPSAVVRFFPNTFEEIEGTNEEDAIANAFARLGDDGWELTGVATNFSVTDGTGKTSTVYYFKRPKRAQQEQE